MWVTGHFMGDSPSFAISPEFESRDAAAVAALNAHEGRRAVVGRMIAENGERSFLDIVEVARENDGAIKYIAYPAIF